MVPFSRCRVISKLSFIFSASAEESRISSPIAVVNYRCVRARRGAQPVSLGPGVCGKGTRWAEQRTSFSILTFPKMPSTCPSFWLSSSLSVASLYWPLEDAQSAV